MSNRKVNGSVVAVTGARGGVGRAVVREFAKRRGSIALLARGEAGLAAAAAEVTAAAALGAGLTAALGRKARSS
jgi:short-subunit dehydrogenase